MAEQTFKPGFASYSSTPSKDSEVFNIENLDRDVDGFWRPRWGLRYLDEYADDISHLSVHPNGQAVMTIHGGTLAYWKDSGTKGDIDTGWPSGVVHATVAPGASQVWLAHKAAVSSDTPGDLVQVDASYADSVVAAAPSGTFAEVHNRILFSIDSSNDNIRWSDYDDYTTWPGDNDANKLPEMITAEVIVNAGNNRSILFGQQGLTEVSGGDDGEISFATLQKEAVAMPGHLIFRVSERIAYLAPGPRLKTFQYGRPDRIDWPVARDLRSFPSLTSLRGWHDASRNNLCLTNLSTNYTHIYNVEEGRWLGFWTYGNAQDKAIVGAASLTGANDQPYSLEYVYAGKKLFRWDSTLYKDQVDTTSGHDVSFRCAIESRPTNFDDQSTLKRLRSIYCDIAGTWTVYLKYRNTVDDAWTEVAWGTRTGPGILPPPARYEFREFELRAVADSASGLRFRALQPDVQVVSGAKR